MADHDGAYHRLFGAPRLIRELLTDVIKPPWLHTLDLDTLERVNIKLHGVGPRSQGVKRREGDLLWKMKRRDGRDVYLFLAIEFQSEPYLYMAVRFMVYLGLLYQHLIQEGQIEGGRLPPVFPIVIYNGVQNWGAPRSLRELMDISQTSPLYDILPELRYYLVDELRHPADDSSLGDSLLLQLLKLEQSENVKMAMTHLRALVDILSGEDDGSVFGAVADFLNAARLPPALNKLDGDFHRLLKKENVMLLRDRAKQWEAQLEEREAQQFKKGTEEGLRRGEALGLRKGEALGRQKALKATLVEILETRFQSPPPQVLKAIEAMDREDKLKELTLGAATAPSWAHFRALLKADSPKID